MNVFIMYRRESSGERENVAAFSTEIAARLSCGEAIKRLSNRDRLTGGFGYEEIPFFVEPALDLYKE